MNLNNKVVWITGASSGIGEALAIELAKHNCKLILSARRKEELDRVAGLTELSSDNLLILPIDLEQYEQVELCTQQAMDKFGRIDVLINNGGISQEGLVLETTQVVEQKIMDINYFGNVALSKSVAKIMQKQRFQYRNDASYF